MPTAHVHRPRLLELLAGAESLPLVVVSAPAGTGKTTLLAEWVWRARPARTTGWITFEDGDTAFWSLVLERLARLGLDIADRGVEGTAENGLGRPRLMALAQLIVAMPEQLTIVLDGYEPVSPDLGREVDFLLQHTLGKLRLVFVSRVDPPLPLYRYRLTDTLLEIRVADLAFTDEEAAQLMSLSKVTLGRGAVHELNERVNGWAAGLRFAARVLAGRDDPDGSVAVVIGQTGEIKEYLLGEVLEVQTSAVRRFLLDTCVLDVLSPEPVKELGGAAAVHILAEIGKLNVFIEPLPDRPGSFRYYPFFRDMLRAQLAYEAPDHMIALHRTLARWYERHDLPSQAIDHLAAISAWADIAAMITNRLLVGRLLVEGRGGPLATVGRQLPRDLDDGEPCVVRAAAALTAGDRADCAHELSRAGRAAERGSAEPAQPTGILRLSISVVDAALAGLTHDIETAAELTEQAEHAVSALGPSAPAAAVSEMTAVVQFSRGLVAIRRGELPVARRALTYASELEDVRPFAAFRADCLGYLAIVAVLDGHLWTARQAADRSLALATGAGRSPADRSVAAQVALACVAFEQYGLKAAHEYVTAARATRALAADPVSRSLVEGVVAGLFRAQGHMPAALGRLRAAWTGMAASDPRLADRLRVRAATLSVASGRPDLALGVLAAVQDPGTPGVAVAQAAAHAEEGDQAAVRDYLARAAGTPHPLPLRVAGLLVEAALEADHGLAERAHLTLRKALGLAAPEGMRRPFREAGPAVQRLLTAESRLVLEHRWLSQPGGFPTAAYRPRAGGHEATATGLVAAEELTSKELEVLGHLQELLTTEEIARTMSVSVNTVRTHIRGILRKLGVGRRNAAVRKARELGLIKREPGHPEE